MENLDVLFAEHMEIIVERFGNNRKALAVAVLGLVRNPIYQEYFNFIHLDKVYVDPNLGGDKAFIKIYFNDRVVPHTVVEHPTSITRTLFDNPKYLEFGRKKLSEHVSR